MGCEWIGCVIVSVIGNATEVFEPIVFCLLSEIIGIRFGKHGGCDSINRRGPRDHHRVDEITGLL